MVRSDRATRRKVLKMGSASAITLTSLAGCAGTGGSGGDGGGSSGDGGGSTGNGGSSGDETTVNITHSQEGFTGIVMDHIAEETDILATELSDRGYSPNIQSTWKGPALFASGSADFSSIGGLEAARLASERDVELAVNGTLTAPNTGTYVQSDSQFDPSETGGVDASITKIADEGGVIGIPGWQFGFVPLIQVLMEELYDLSFTEDGDFNVTTSEPPAIPDLITRGDLAAGLTSPMHGALSQIREDQITPLWFSGNLMQRQGFPTIIYNGWTTTKEFADNNSGAVKALVGAWQQGLDWFWEDPMARATQEKYLSWVYAENAAQAEYIVEWALLGEHGLETPVMREDCQLTDDLIEQDKEYVSRAEEMGAVPSGWEDLVTYRNVSPE